MAAESVGVRRFPTATDVLVIAEDQGLTDVHLERVGSISSGFWSDQSKWIGTDVPNITQDVYIRHGGGDHAQRRSAGAKPARNAAGAASTSRTHRLTVDGALTFDGGALSVARRDDRGRQLSGDPGALIDNGRDRWFGSTISRRDRRQRRRPASTAASRSGTTPSAFVPGSAVPGVRSQLDRHVEHRRAVGDRRRIDHAPRSRSTAGPISPAPPGGSAPTPAAPAARATSLIERRRLVVDDRRGARRAPRDR